MADKIDMTGAKEIKLAGQAWKIPEMAIRQKRIITPLWLRLFPVMQKLGAEGKLHEMETAQWDDAIEIIFQAMNRGYPHMTRDSILDMKITFPELIAALPVITTQAGFESDKDAAPGEAKGEPSSSPQIGESTSTT